MMSYSSQYLAIYPVMDKFPYIVEILYLSEGFLFSIIISRKFKILTSHNNQLINLQKELIHRVKNNMQIILSIVNLQSRTIADKLTKTKFDEIKNRILSMSHIHDLLNNNANSSIKPREYFDLLIENIVSIFENEYDVEYELICDEEFDTENLNDVGLILNELVLNSFKYAFKDKTGHISIKLQNKENKYIIKVEDDGVGITNNVRENSLGLSLVEEIVKEKLNGSMQITSKDGTKILIRYG